MPGTLPASREGLQHKGGDSTRTPQEHRCTEVGEEWTILSYFALEGVVHSRNTLAALHLLGHP